MTTSSKIAARPGALEQNSDQLHVRLHGMWATVADAWAAHADYADARGAPITDAMLRQRHTPGNVCWSLPVDLVASVWRLQ